MPTPSSTMPVARQLPSRLRQWGAKSARRAPTWDPSTLSGWGSWRSLARLLASLEGSWTGPSGASLKGRLLCHSPLRRGGRGPQAVKHWRSWSRLLGWCHFLAGLGFSLLREERQRRASHHVGLPDGTDTILKDLWFGTHHMVSLKRCRPHSSKNLGLEVEVLQKSVSTQQLQVWRGCKACRNHGNLSFLNNGQLLPEKFRAFILGGEFFNHWSHHRVSKRCVDGWPTSKLFCLQTHPMWHMVWRRGLVVTESVVTRRLGRVEGITVNLETVRFPGENLLDREELEGGEVWVQSLRQCSLDHIFIFFKPLC